jgi:hypothetical protein
MSANAAWIHGIARVITILATVGSADANAGDVDDPARVRRAVAYLDGRQDDWSAFAGAKRGKDADRTSCVSCHTGVSYALARPSLRRFTAKPEPSEAEARMIAAVTLRVEHWAELDSPRFRLMYDNDARKKVESRGTEAVLNALILARADAARGARTPGDATRAAFTHLWATQTQDGDDDGSWTWLNFGLEPWEATGSRAFGASLAAIAVGSAPGYLAETRDDPAARGVRALREYLRRRFPRESLYNRLWILEASTNLDGILSAEQKQEVVDQLLPLQRDDGGWSLSSLGTFKRVDGTAQAKDSDGYATGLILQLLVRAGHPTARPEVVHGLAWLRSHQQKDGSWPGRSMNKERDPSTFTGKLMTDAATAISAQALIELEAR